MSSNTPLPDWAAYLLENHGNIPHVPSSYLSYARYVFGYVSMAKSYLVPLIDQVSRKPDLATVALLLVIIFVSLKILNMLYQTVMFWVRMVRKVAFWGGLAVIVLWLYTRGPNGVADDVQYWYDTWSAEYHRYQEQERIAQLMRRQQQGMPGHRQAFW